MLIRTVSLVLVPTIGIVPWISASPSASIVVTQFGDHRPCLPCTLPTPHSPETNRITIATRNLFVCFADGHCSTLAVARSAAAPKELAATSRQRRRLA
jgi:hypothetical protein